MLLLHHALILRTVGVAPTIARRSYALESVRISPLVHIRRQHLRLSPCHWFTASAFPTFTESALKSELVVVPR